MVLRKFTLSRQTNSAAGLVFSCPKASAFRVLLACGRARSLWISGPFLGWPGGNVVGARHSRVGDFIVQVSYELLSVRFVRATCPFPTCSSGAPVDMVCQVPTMLRLGPLNASRV